MVQNIAEDIKILNLKKEFLIQGQALEVLHNINLTVEPGEIVCIVGGSGCGKSTLLRMVAGLETPTAGEIIIGNKQVGKPTIDVGVLFQESRLLPWSNVEKNVAFGLSKNLPPIQKKELVQEYIDLVGLTGFEKALPGQLSGGMQKRVSIARTLINRPNILLLDEPFGALDAFTKINLQQELLKIWERLKMTTILVTHDIEEAVYMGNKVIVMSPKPGIIKKEISVPLSRPRNRTSEEFSYIRRKVYLEFFDEDTYIEYNI